MSAKKNKNLINSINLLPDINLASTKKGRIVTWLLGTFRIIVIITELIVVAAFFSRFALDSKNADLNDNIAQKQAIILSYSEVEKEINFLRQKIAVYQDTTKDQGEKISLLESINKSLPREISLSKIEISEEDLKIEGISVNEKSVQQLLANLNSFENLSSVDITDFGESRENNAFLFFTIHASLKNKT